MKKTPTAEELRIKRTTGFHALKEGRIHIRCPECGMKRSNVRRADYDPGAASLIEALCETCCVTLGALEPGVDYYDAQGEPVDPCQECTADRLP